MLTIEYVLILIDFERIGTLVFSTARTQPGACPTCVPSGCCRLNISLPHSPHGNIAYHTKPYCPPNHFDKSWQIGTGPACVLWESTDSRPWSPEAPNSPYKKSPFLSDPGIPGVRSMVKQVIQVIQVIDWRRWPFLVAPSGGQIWNLCKWRHLVANFATNSSGAIWWTILQLMQITPSGGQICN